MQPLALAGAVTARSDRAAIAHAKVFVMFFSEGLSGGFTTQLAQESSLDIDLEARARLLARG
jgi:hypothetical protein